MAEPILRLEGLTKRFGGLTVSDAITLDVAADETHAIIGPNGAGKTTLVNQIAGVLQPDHGHIHFAGQDVTRWSVHARAAAGLARSFQITSVVPSFSALDNVALAVQSRSGSSFRLFGDVAKETALNERAMAALDDVDLADRAMVRAANLSHGEKRSLELAMALALEPKLLLLDEPMAGTGWDETERLTALLVSLKGRYPMILVEHDMEAVFALADRISVLVNGRVIATGAPDAVRADPAVRTAYLGDEAH
jgi:branched-chain amino acid transport system ATP-binding protein